MPDPLEEVARLRARVEADPTDADAQFALALALRNLGDYKAALPYAEAAADLRPEDGEAAKLVALCMHLVGAVESAIPWYERALRDAEPSAKLFFNAGVAYDAVLQYERAATHYRAALQLEPCYPEALNNLGIVLANLKRFADAAKTFHALLEIRDAPDRHKVHNNLGLVYLHQGRTREAVLSFRAAVALDPDFSIAWTNLGNAYFIAGDGKEAEAAYRKAIACDPDNVMAYQALGALGGSGKAASDSVVAEYEAYLDRHPWSALVYYNLAMALAERGETNAALEQLDKALLMEPQFVEARRAKDVLEQQRG